jgi:putative protein-disulfide isomerase
MKKINSTYKKSLEIEVISGGMILPEEPVHIAATAAYIDSAYKNVEAVTGVKFGTDYLWHIKNPQQTDWYPNSEKPAIALCIFKEYYPDQQVLFATDLQYALNYEGRDLTDDEAYRHLADKYDIPFEDFTAKLYDEFYKAEAHAEFDLCKKLQVTAFPAVLMQENESKFHLLARGYTDFDTLDGRIKSLLSKNAA